MTPEQALSVLEQIVAQAPLRLAESNTMQQAVQVLRNLVSDNKKKDIK